jgi:hypothetical protein
MSDFLGRMIGRAQGAPSAIQPLVRPRFAPVGPAALDPTESHAERPAERVAEPASTREEIVSSSRETRAPEPSLAPSRRSSSPSPPMPHPSPRADTPEPAAWPTVRREHKTAVVPSAPAVTTAALVPAVALATPAPVAVSPVAPVVPHLPTEAPSPPPPLSSPAERLPARVVTTDEPPPIMRRATDLGPASATPARSSEQDAATRVLVPATTTREPGSEPTLPAPAIRPVRTAPVTPAEAPSPPSAAAPTAAPTVAAPTIRVSIGRLEIRAVLPAPQARPSARSRSAPASLGLAEFLKGKR